MPVRISRYSLHLVRESTGTYDLASKKIDSPQSAARAIRSIFDPSTLAVEHFGVLTLDSKNKIIGIHMLAIGSLNAAIVHPRGIFQVALLNNAASVIMFHNHPSGDPTPSPEDVSLTSRISEIGDLMGINVFDHIVLGEFDHVSIRESHSSKAR